MVATFVEKLLGGAESSADGLASPLDGLSSSPGTKPEASPFTGSLSGMRFDQRVSGARQELLARFMEEMSQNAQLMTQSSGGAPQLSTGRAGAERTGMAPREMSPRLGLAPIATMESLGASSANSTLPFELESQREADRRMLEGLSAPARLMEPRQLDTLRQANRAWFAVAEPDLQNRRNLRSLRSEGD